MTTVGDFGEDKGLVHARTHSGEFALELEDWERKLRLVEVPRRSRNEVEMFTSVDVQELCAYVICWGRAGQRDPFRQPFRSNLAAESAS